MRRKDCDEPEKVYSHIEPYMGGPEKNHEYKWCG